MKIPEEELDGEMVDEDDESTEKKSQNKDAEIDSEEEQINDAAFSVEVDNEETNDKFEDIEDIIDETDIVKDLIDESKINKNIFDEKRSESSLELSKEDLNKQMNEYHKNLIEASLYAAGKPLNVEILSTKLEIPKKTVEELLNELAYDYLERSTALIINQIGDSYQMAIKSEYVEKISKFASGGAIAERYLRTLTIIALKQPILKSTVIKLRGSGAYEHIKYLLDNDLIESIKKGRSRELSTTDKYAEMFGLPKDKELMKEMMISQLGLGDQVNQSENENE